jgi:hypothetical protein
MTAKSLLLLLLLLLLPGCCRAAAKGISFSILTTAFFSCSS